MFSKTGKKILLLLLIGVLNACGQSEAGIDSSSSSSQPSQNSSTKTGPDYFALVAGPTIKFYSPAVTPTRITTPTLLVAGGGMKSGSYVYVYKKPNCTVLAKTFKAATTSAKIKLPALANGSYKFSAKVKTGTAYSACRAASAYFIVDTVAPSAPAVTSPTAGSTVSATPTIAGSCETGAKVYLTGDLASVPSPATCAASAYSFPTTLTGGDGSKNLSVKQIDKAGNISATTSFNIIKDTSLVTATINQSGGQADPTNNQVVSFQVVFGKAINPASFSASDINQTGSAAGVVWNTPTTSDNITWTIQTSAIGTDGTVIPTISAGQVADPVGNLNSASSSSDNSVSFDTTPPTIAISAPSVTLIKAGFINYDLTYTNASTINLSAGDITVNTSGTVDYSLSVQNGTTSHPKITIHVTDGDGTIDSISIASGTSHDVAGNNDSGKSESTVVTVDSTAVTVSINSPSISLINSGAVDYAVEYAGGTSINLTAGDISVVATGTVTYNVSVDNGTTATPTIHINVTGGDGILDSISINAGTSNNGATSDAGATEGTDVSVDNTAPTIAINAPMTSVNNTNKAAYSFSGTCSEEGKEVTINAPASIAGAHVTCTSGAFSFSTQDVSAESDGAVTFTVQTTDAAGNSNTNSVDATKDVVVPTVSIEAPSATLIKTGDITYNVTYSGSDAINLAANNVTVNQTGTVNYSIAVNNGTTSTPTITITINSGDGVIDSISIAGSVATDLAGNTDIGNIESTDITVDNTAPTLAINTPVYINNANKTNYGFDGTCSEEGQDVNITAPSALVGTHVACSSGTFSFSGLDLSASVDGSVTLTVQTTDVAGNSGSGSANANKDTTNPTAAVNSPAVINNANKVAYTFSGTCSENGRAVSITSPASVSGTATCTAGAFSFSGKDFSAESDGSVSIAVGITDLAGNPGSGSNNATKDTANPTVAINSPAVIFNGNKTAYGFSGTCSEEGRNVTITAPAAIAGGTAVCTSGAFSFSNKNVSASADGSVTLTVQTTDAAGNSGSGSASATKDTANPTVAITSPGFINNANKTSYSFSGTCSENGQDVNITAPAALVGTHVACSSGTYSFSGLDLSASVDGSVTLTVQIADIAGNSGTGSANATKDTVNPTVAINSLSYINNANKASYSFTGTCSENGRAVSITAPSSIAGGTVTCTAGSFSFSAKNVSAEIDGTVGFTVQTTDAAGNSGTGSANATKDTVNPTVAINALNYINTANKTSYGFTGTCSEEGQTVSITAPAVSGSGTCTSGAYSISSVNMNAIPDGTVNFTVRILDVAGNQGTATLGATKDTVAPTVSALTLSSPTTSPNNITTPAIRVAGTFPIGDSFHLYSDLTCTTSISGSTAAASANAVVVTSNALVDGSYAFFAKGTDAAGNTTCDGVHSVAYTLDTVAPTVTITSPIAINNANKASYSFSGTCTQNGDTLTIIAPTGVTGTTTCASGAYTFSAKNMTSQADGTVGISVRASDAAGNTATASANATKDTVAPTITISTLASIVSANQAAYSISGTCTANGDAISITAPAISGSATCSNGVYSISNIDASSLAQGTVNFTLRIQDAVGNQTTASASTTKDTVAPTIPSCTSVGTDAMPTKSGTVTWTGSTDATSGINHYEMSVGLSSPADTVGWTNIGASVAPYQFTGLSPKLLFNTDYITYIRAVDNVGNISDYDTCDAWHLKNGYGNFTGTQSTASTNPTYLNQATAFALKYSADFYNNLYFTHSTSTNSQNITIKEPGNYLLSHTLPLYRVNGNTTANVAAASSTVKVNGTAVDIGFASNSFTRGTSGGATPTNSSNHMTVLLKNLAANDVITIETQNTGLATEPLAVPVGDNFSTYLEYIPDEADIFMAKATQTTAGTTPTNLNQSSTLYYKWAESVKDAAYTHNDVTNPQNITVANQGDYLVSVNVPYTGAASNLKIQAAVYVNGSNLNQGSYTEALNGFISNLNGQVTSSTTYTNVLYNVPAGATINVRVIRQGSTGTVTVPVGKAGTIFIEKINTGADYYIATGTSPANWNITPTASIAWATDHVIDNSLFTHTLATEPITIQSSGDYMVYVSARIFSGVNYAHPIMHLAVNGTVYPGATCSSDVTRTTRTATQSSSCDMQIMLQGLNANDQITLTTIKDTSTATITGQPPRITIHKISE